MELEKFIFEGKTKEEAIEKACKELNLPKEKLEIEVLEQGSSGIFGIGGRKSRIKVKIKEKVINEDPKNDDVITIAKEALENILKLIQITDANVIAERDEKGVSLKIEGKNDLGLLIGKGGRTLDAIEFILNRMVNKRLKRNVLVTLDIQAYRERRKEQLWKLAISMANKAKKTKKPITTDPLNARDRRIIHLALKNDSEIETKSVGDGELRKVVILPKNVRDEKREDGS